MAHLEALALHGLSIVTFTTKGHTILPCRLPGYSFMYAC
jgi:hypothetical protein